MRKLLFASAMLMVAIQTTTLAESAITLAVEEKPAPESLDAEVRDLLEPKAYQLSDADGLFFEFWFVKQLELTKKPASSDEALKSIPEVALFGAMIVHQDKREDFREDVIDPGTYVMRLGMQPQDGNHMGTSPTDTFAVLIPADRDRDVRAYPEHDEMVDISLEHTAANHPPILSLQPRENAGEEYPHLDTGGNDWHFVCLKLPAKAGEETFDITLQMVIEGIGYL